MEPAFEVGETVIVDHKEKSVSPFAWVSKMDGLIGCEGVIVKRYESEGTFFYYVKLSVTDQWWFQENALISIGEATNGYKPGFGLSELFSMGGNYDEM